MYTIKLKIPIKTVNIQCRVIILLRLTQSDIVVLLVGAKL